MRSTRALAGAAVTAAALLTVACEDHPRSRARDDAAIVEDAAGAVQLPLPIDDFEDGDLNLIPQAGRTGTWYTYGDGSGSQGLHVAAGGAEGSASALRTAGNGFTGWGAGIGVHLVGSGDFYNACGYGGISFRARSAIGPASLRVNLPDRGSMPAGGCSGCYDHFGASVDIDTEWKQYTLTWNQLGQQGWGDAHAAIDLTGLIAIEFLRTEAALFDVWVDDVSFIPGAGTTANACGITQPTGSGGRMGSGGALGMGGAGGWTPPTQTPIQRWGQLSVCGTKLCSAAGTPVQLKGPSTMWLNWESTYGVNKGAMQWMRDNWGMTVFRAAMGVEPTGAYLTHPAVMKAAVETIIQNAIDLGVYVLVDWHDHNAATHQDQAVAFFSEMAARWGSYPNVLWETFNEPLKVSWSNVLKPYHQAVVAAIRTADPDNVIVLGTPQWSQLVDEAANDPLAGTNLMYTLHFYACTHSSWLRNKGDAAIAKGLALFATEWGGTNADGGLDGKVCYAETQLWHDWMAAQGISWAAWKLDDCTPDSSCILKAGAPADGGWTDEWLHGHGPFVRDRMRE